MTTNGTANYTGWLAHDKIQRESLKMNIQEDNSQYDYTEAMPCIDQMSLEQLQDAYVAMDNEYLDLCNDYEDLHLDYLELDAECAQLRYELEVARKNSAI